MKPRPDPVSYCPSRSGHRFVRSIAAATLAIVAFVVAGPAALAREVPDKVAKSKVPPWFKEAAARSTPATDARAVALLDEMVVEPLAEGGVRVRYRFAYRILTTAGIDLAQSFRNYNVEDRFERAEAYSQDPQTGVVRRAHVKNNTLRDYPGWDDAPGYTGSRVRVLEAPGARVGSVVGFETVVVRDIDVGGTWHRFGERDFPTAFSRLRARVPEGWGLAHSLVRAGGRLEVSATENELTVVATDLDAVPYREDLPPASFLLPEVHIRWKSPDGSRGFDDWAGVGRWYADLTNDVFGDLGEASEIARRFTPATPEDLPASIAGAFDFASRDVRYVAIEVGIGGYRPFSPATVCSTRYGDCKDKSFLLVSFFRAWGFESFPVLVRTRHLGPLVLDNPHAGAFNHCIVAVKLPDAVGPGEGDWWPVGSVPGIGRVLYLDGTSREGNAWTLPEQDQGTTALLVRPDGDGVLVDLPVQPPSAATVRRTIRLSVDDHGKIGNGEIVEAYDGTSASAQRARTVALPSHERERYVAEGLQSRFSGATLEAYETHALEDTSRPFVERYEITGGSCGKRVGDLMIIEPGKLSSGIATAPVLPDVPAFDLLLDQPETEETVMRIDVPDGWVPEELPDAWSLDTDELEVRMTWSFADGVLQYERSMRQKVNVVPPARYTAYRDACMQMAGEAKQGVVLVKL